MHERRTVGRQRIFKAGKIEFDGIAVECTVRNISEAGAGLEIMNPVGIPHQITLNIVTRDVRYHGHVVWRQKRRIGIAFSSAALSYKVD